MVGVAFVYQPLLLIFFSQRYVAYLTKPQYDKLGLKDQGTILEKYVILSLRSSVVLILLMPVTFISKML